MTTVDDILNGLKECLPNRPVQIDANEDLLVAGVLDSLTFVDFVAAVESRFRVTLPDEIVFSNKFNTLSQISAAVSNVKGAQDGK